MTIKIRGIDHIVLRVVELDVMLDFYCGLLGCTMERRQDEIGLVQLRVGQQLLDLVPVSGKLGRVGGSAPGAEGRNLDHLCFRIEDTDLVALATALQAAGVRVGELGSRYGAEGEGLSLYLYDPEGNQIELRGAPGTAGEVVA